MSETHKHVEEPGPSEVRSPLVQQELKRAGVWFGLAIAIALTALGARLAARLGLQRLVPYGLALAWAAIYAFYVMKRLGS